MKEKRAEVSFGAIVATIGSVLIALGVIWMIALNWRDIPSALKIFILVLSTAGAFFAGITLRVKGYPKIAESLLILGSLLYTWSIFLIAQIFSTEATMQGVAFLWLLAWIGVLIVAYLFKSSPSLLIALVEFLIWIGVQISALILDNSFIRNPPFGFSLLAYLSCAVLFYGLMHLHKAYEHPFSKMYRFFTMLYLLILTYILSFQLILPNLWPENSVITSSILLFTMSFGIISLVFAGFGLSLSYSKNRVKGKEILFSIIIVLVYLLLILLATTVSGARTGGFGYGTLHPGLFFLWLFDNILFIGVIIAVIGYGVKNKSESIVNMGIAFFVLDIITRYIGFIMDFGGKMGFALTSIIGGIILIFGGWGIEKWRKDLLLKTREKNGLEKKRIR